LELFQIRDPHYPPFQGGLPCKAIAQTQSGGL
jgi:hypothetical protein